MEFGDYQLLHIGGQRTHTTPTLGPSSLELRKTFNIIEVSEKVIVSTYNVGNRLAAGTLLQTPLGDLTVLSQTSARCSLFKNPTSTLSKFHYAIQVADL